MFADFAICPEDGKDGKTSSWHVDATAVSAALWNGVGLVIHKLPEIQLSETCGILCQAAWQGYWWHLVVKLLGGRAPQVQFTD